MTGSINSFDMNIGRSQIDAAEKIKQIAFEIQLYHVPYNSSRNGYITKLKNTGCTQIEDTDFAVIFQAGCPQIHFGYSGQVNRCARCTG